MRQIAIVLLFLYGTVLWCQDNEDSNFQPPETPVEIQVTKAQGEITLEQLTDFRRQEIENLFLNLFKYSKKNPFHQGRAYQQLSMYQGYCLREYELSNESAFKAINLYKLFLFSFARIKEKSAKNNIMNNYISQGKCSEALPFFKKDVRRDKELILWRSSYKSIIRCYESLGVRDSIDYYTKLMKSIDLRVDEYNRTTQTALADKRYDYSEINKDRNSLKKSLFYIISILAFLSLVLFLIFYLYKRYKKKSSILEEEKQETSQKIDELEKSIFKNHIDLNNKTRVYVFDLIYIKADDHYINLFVKDELRKEGFRKLTDRNSLKEIKKQLPPNFVQCHRSYIINTNLVQRKDTSFVWMEGQNAIPISRSYKGRI